MIVVGDTLQVFSFCPIADVRVDVPPITLMLPDAARHCGAFVFADEVVTITMLDTYGRDAFQTDLPESIDEGVDSLAMRAGRISSLMMPSSNSSTCWSTPLGSFTPTSREFSMM